MNDKEDIVKVFTILLKSEGYNNVSAFSSSKKALNHVASLENSSYYKLGLIDIKMTEINGIELYQKLKKINADLKVIFLTSFDNVAELTKIQQKLNRMIF